LTIFGAIFYVLAAFIVAATALAVTRRDPIHAVICLVISFLGSAMLFYLLGAPFLAAIQVIIYAGAIMVLFLFVIMMLSPGPGGKRSVSQWAPAVLLGTAFLLVAGLAATLDSGGSSQLQMATSTPADFGRFIFERYWFAVEIVSLLLFLVLVAAMRLGRGREQRSEFRGQSSAETKDTGNSANERRAEKSLFRHPGENRGPEEPD
jgi:NADH-quinone oxidoreductase subunit J